MIVCLLEIFAEGVWQVPCTARMQQKQLLIKISNTPLRQCLWSAWAWDQCQLKAWSGLSTQTLWNRLCFLHTDPADFSPACQCFQHSASLILLESSVCFKSSFLSTRGKNVRDALESMWICTLSLTPLCCGEEKIHPVYVSAVEQLLWQRAAQPGRPVVASQMKWACSPISYTDLSAAPSV